MPGIPLRLDHPIMLARPNCLWCGVKLKPRFQMQCKHCQHLLIHHRITPSAQQEHCRNCRCTHIAIDAQQFEKVLFGYGYRGLSLFCASQHGAQWAHDRARRALPIDAALRQIQALVSGKDDPTLKQIATLTAGALGNRKAAQ